MGKLCVLLMIIFSGHVAASDNFYTLIKFSSNWSQYCAVSTSFKSSLATYVSLQTKSRVLSSELSIASTAESCSNKEIQSNAAEIRVTVFAESPNNGTVSESRTKALVDALKGGPNVGGLKISSVQFQTEVSRKVFTTKNIIILIAVVCVTYFIGFACILGTADRDKQSGQYNQTILIPKGNPGYDHYEGEHIKEKADELKHDLANGH